MKITGAIRPSRDDFSGRTGRDSTRVGGIDPRCDDWSPSRTNLPHRQATFSIFIFDQDKRRLVQESILHLRQSHSSMTSTTLMTQLVEYSGDILLTQNSRNSLRWNFGIFLFKRQIVNPHQYLIQRPNPRVALILK